MTSIVIQNQTFEMLPIRQRTNTGGPICLHDAVRDNNFEAVQTSLKRDGTVGIDAPDDHEFAPIHYAAKFNCFRILKLLVENGADPNLKTKGEGLTPLHLAARYQPHSSADTQLPDRQSRARGSIVSLTDAKQEQLTSSKQAVEFLKERMAEVNVPDKYSNTPLHMACQRGNVDAVQELMKSDHINLTARNKNERNTPLHEACLYGNSKIVEILLKKLKAGGGGKDWVLQNKADQTPLHLACREGHCDIVKLLFDCITPNQKEKLLKAKDNEDNTALHLACEKGNVEMVSFLLTNGADPYLIQLPKRVTPLHVAASLGHIQVVDVLLKADVNLVLAEDKVRQTPVHYAVLANDRDVLESFKKSLEKNDMMDRMNSPDKQSRTPLLLAAMLGKDAAFQMLLEILPQDAHDSLDRDGKSVLCLAAEYVFNKRIFTSFKKSPVMYKKLVAAPDANLNTPLHIAAEKGNVTIVKYLLNEPDDLAKKNARNADYRTPIHLAAKNGYIEVVRLLLTANSLCAVEDENGDTPLHLACAMGHSGVVHVLHHKRVNPDARNYKDHTPLHCAAIGGHNTLVEVLINDFNAEVDPTDRNCFTPLLLAAQAGHLNVVIRLLEHEAQAWRKVEEFNALDLAIDNGHEKIAMAIVKSSQWKKALRNTTDSPLWGQTTPLRKLIRSMPKVAEVVFDRCTKPGTTRVDSKDYSVTFNYEFVEDFQDPVYSLRTNPMRASLFNLLSLSYRKGYRTTWGPKKFSKAKHPLTIMLENERTDLLTHPLVRSLLRYKWYKYGRYIYWFDLFLYMIFVIFLTAFALVLPNPESQTCQAVLNGTFGSLSGSNCSMENLQTPECGECGLNTPEKIFIIVASVIIVVYSIASFVFHLFLYIRLYQTYLKDWATVFNFFAAVTTVIFAVVHFTHCFCPYNWQWQLGTVAVFLAWVNFCVLFRKLPLTGIYVLMFVKVFYTFCKVIILSFLLVIAFSLGFYMAFHQPLTVTASRSPFSSPARSIVKTMTMIVGEFDYEDIFHLSSLEPEVMLEEIPYFQVANLLWILFLIVAPILFLNLLTGLAVDDIKRIQEDAALKRLELQILGVLSIEEAVPAKFRSRFMITKKCTIKPNKGLRLLEKVRHNVWEEECYDTIESMSKALEQRLRNREGNTEQTQCGHNSLVEDVANIKRTVHELRSLVEALSLKTDSDQAQKRSETQFLRIHHGSSYVSDAGLAGDFFED